MSQGIYAPAAGITGTAAVHKDSSVFVSWASACQITRGYQQIDDSTLGLASQGNNLDATRKADGVAVSLGDGGEGTLTLSMPIFNGPGADFAVFENGFSANFLELAFVEVSSNGTDYFRFPTFSNTQDSSQIGTFGNVEASHIHNLAGKYAVNYGTPFDLDDIPVDSLLNKNSITHIKIIDVIGNITQSFGTFDSQNNIINDPWPTPFASSGFDLDAVGLIHVNGINSIVERKKSLSIYPNPFIDRLKIEIDDQIIGMQLVSLSGALIEIGNSKELNLSHLSTGVYFLKITTKTNFYVKKLLKK
ncbi:MAG: T9SS type A sorting domain-containing protein [Flavobacteriales bacterium]